MFLKNIAKKDIKLSSFEGYVFAVPPGISAIWNPAGKQLLSVHKVESSGKDKFGLDNGHGVPALSESTKAVWIKDGRKLVSVKRFQIDPKQIPRASLIMVAHKRGVEQTKIVEYQMDSQIEVDQIAADINNLPIPDEIRYPEKLEDDNNDE